MPLPSSCAGCPIAHPSKNYVGPDGLMVNGVLIVGESPTEQEMAIGKPFSGTPGKMLDSLLRKAGLQRESFAFDNVIKCKAPPPEHYLSMQGAMQKCAPNLEDTIKKYQPKVILTLGANALERVTGLIGINRYRGYPIQRPDGIWVVPTYAPSYLLPKRGQKSTSHLTPAVIFDFKRAMEIAREGFERHEGSYLCDPTPPDAMGFWREWVEADCPPLSIDIETPHKLTTIDEGELEEIDAQILRVSYCFRPGYAMSIPWTAEYMECHAAFLEWPFPHDKIWWNGWHFDIPVIEGEGKIKKVTGRQIDAMWAWHYLQPDLPRGLESVGSFFYSGLPWKHMGKSEPAKYNAIDADAALQIYLGVRKGLEKTGQWEGFVEFTLELDPYLREAGQNGVHINRRNRRKLYKKLRRIQKAALAKVQEMVPQELRPRKHYIGFPHHYEGTRGIEFVRVMKPGKKCQACGAEGILAGTHTAKKKKRDGEDMPNGNPCYKAPIVSAVFEQLEYDVVMDFNPLSQDQMQKYIEHFGHPMGRNAKNGNPTVDDHHLEKLIAKYGHEHPIYRVTTELRTVGKALSTYVEGLNPSEFSGTVNTQYTYAPASGRLSSKGLIRGKDRGVNLQNIPHRGDLEYAGEIRACIVPRPGYVFVEADSSSIEAVFTAYYMGDPGYLALAQMGIHAAWCAQSLGQEVNAENAKAIKKLAGSGTDKKIQMLYERKKKTVHGVSYGMGAHLLATLYPQYFKGRNEAQAEIDSFYEFVPLLKKWHHETRVKAHQECYLELPLGKYRRYFYDVFSYDRDQKGNILLNEKGEPKIKLGEDSKACIAQKPQGTAGMFMRRNARNIGRDIKERGLPFYLPGNFLVHDSYCLEVPDTPGDIQIAVELLADHLTRPIPEMGGIRVGCEIKVGYDWDSMKSVKTIKV